MFTINDIKQAVKDALVEHDRLRDKDKLYSINEIAKRLGCHHSTIKKKVLSGLIKTTKDGLISETAINEYLNKNDSN